MNHQLIEIIEQRKISNLLKQSEDVVISGVGGRFPLSNNIDEFANNLFNNIDMITEDQNQERWPKSLYGITNRMGRVKSIDKFDGPFFGYLAKNADAIEPESRILLETTYEAIVDAGINPQQLRGTNTGVYIGHTKMGISDGYPSEIQLDSLNSRQDSFLWSNGASKYMLANRLSFAFDFKGPSFVVDTACSSSLVAFDLAVTDLRLGKCDMAIVGSAQLSLEPFINFILQTNNIISVDGIPKVWDKDANGFVSSEAIGCVLLQKKSQAKRIYTTVIHSKNNVDGYKMNGQFFPSKELQQKLMEETYIEAGIDPNDVEFVETHGTGTKAGDPVEAEAIVSAYCKNRKEKLLIGLLKSNIGHCESSAGLASITKTIISLEHKCIPANLYPKTIKSSISKFCPPLEPVNQNTQFQPKYCAINSFGLGGVNAHVILKGHKKELTKDSFLIADKIPRLINFCGRTQDAVDYVFDFIERNPSKVTRDFLALLNDTSKYTQGLQSAGFPFRGSLILKQKELIENRTIAYTYSRETTEMKGLTKPIWFVFSGMGSQWIGMAKALMSIDKFAETINKCAQVLKQFKVDLLDILLSDDETALNSTVNPFIAITSMQIALFDLLKEVDIEPDKIIGHSFGEIACAYADGCLTLEQAMLCSYWRGKVVEDSSVPAGKMAAVGLSWEKANKICPKNVYVVCDNAHDSVTISGLEEDMIKFMEKLKSENIFVVDVVGFNLKPYHSNCLKPVADVMIKILKNAIPQPKLRSSKWVSTSIPISNWGDDLAQYASAKYFANNLIKPVLFRETLFQAPSNAIVIEIAPHTLFAGLIKKTLKEANYIELMKHNNDENNLKLLISSLGKLYQAGINPSIEKLYPKVEWPVARGTQSISSLIKWDHSQSYFVRKYPEHYCKSTASDMIFEFSLDNPDDAFLQDHAVDGNIVFPATGYLMIVWRRLAAQRGLQWNQIPVVFENVQLKRSVHFQDGKVKLTVRYIEPTGEFVVLDSGYVVAFGKVFADKENAPLQLQHLIRDMNSLDEIANDFKLNSQEFYKELKIRGYDYGPKFQGVVESKLIDKNRSIGKVRYTNNSNFITTLDSIMQLMVSAIPIRSLFIPASIQSLKCDPLMFLDGVEQIKTDINRKEREMIKNENLKEGLMEYKDQLGNVIEDFEEQTGTGTQKWQSDVPVLFNSKLRALIAKGIEIRGSMTVYLPRRCLSNGLRFEKYQFIPYYENDAIEISNWNQIDQYLTVCLAIFKQILENTKFNCKNLQIVNNLKNIEINQKLINEMTMEIREEHILLNLLNTVLNNQKDFNNSQMAHNLKQKFENLEFDVSKDILNLIGKNERLIRPLLDTVNENVNPHKKLNVLEINITTGIVGIDISQFLIETFIEPVTIEYTIAHNKPEKIKTIKELENIGDYKIVEWIHYNTDFPENINDNFNLIIHRDSIELWNVDLNNYFNEAMKLLKENGFLLAVFRSKITAPEIILDKLSQNENLPNENQLLDRIEKFEKIAIKIGFKLISKKTDSILFTAILFRKISENLDPNEQTVIEIKTGEYHVWIDQLKQAIQEHKSKDKNANIWLHANDSNINGVIGLVQCLRQEIGGDKLRYIFDLDNKLPKKIDFNSSPFKEILKCNLVMNVFKDNKFGSFKSLSLPKNYDKIETTQAYADVLQVNDLSSLQWFDGRNLKNPLLVSNVQQEDVDIYYSSLNFSNVLIAAGRIVTESEGAIIENVFGAEFAGRRRETGERVLGITLGFGIGTETKTHRPSLIKIPDHWSMEDAATVYFVYLTCWYGLIEKAQLKKGESILIHSGAGGVGQAAINICQYYKCKIFTTVSTQEKRDFLKKNYRLTDEQIFNSRDTDFEEKILDITDGDGVDLVLNSLTEEKFLASFRCIGYSGRFIEIEKYDFQQNNPLPMFDFLKNISFYGVSIDKIVLLTKMSNLDLFKKFKTWFYEGVEKGFVKPINRIIFNSEQVKEAFKYMMTGKHIGKVLIKIRDEEDHRKPSKAKPFKMIATTKTWFDKEKVYIIIGGLGGMGLEMVYWMILRGATKFILTSRSGIKTNYQRFFFKQIDQLGKLYESFKVRIEISTENVINEQNAKNVLNQAESIGKIGGIFQLALVLRVALIENQTVEAFDDVCRPKVDATINLDKLSRQLPYQLDYFVCFSSLICGRGNSGQSNYGYANSVMERICENRRKDGLHGLAIEWGAIGDVGALVDINLSDEATKVVGLLMQRSPSWLYALDKFLQCPYPVLVSYIRKEKQFESKYSVEENIMKQLWSAIGVDPKTVPNYVTLSELGIGSFVAVELQQRFKRDYDMNISIEEIKKLTAGHIKSFENKEKIKQFAEHFGIAKENLSKIKFILSNEPVTKLNDISTGKPIYFLPPVETIFHNLIPLAKSLPFPVYGLNWTHELEQMTCFNEMALYYEKLMKTLEPNGNYTLLTTSFGLYIALKMAYMNASIKNIILIETITNDDGDEEDKQDFCENAFRFLKTIVPQNFIKRIRDEIYNIKDDENEKITAFIENLRNFCSFSNTKDLDVIIKGIVKKAKMIKQIKEKLINKIYSTKDESEERIKCDLIIIKSCNFGNQDDNLFQEDYFRDNFFQTYGINKQNLDGKFQIEAVNGSAEELITLNTEKIAQIIKWFK